jgi:hypothetical protein
MALPRRDRARPVAALLLLCILAGKARRICHI